jgi:hypothetical protein
MKSQRGFALVLLALLFALAASPLLAQPTLSQTKQQTTPDGFTLSVSYPDGWEASTSEQGMLIASSASALDDLNKNGVVTKPGDVGVIVSLPSFLDNLNLPHDAPPDQAVTKYLEGAKLTADVKPSSDFSVPAATSIVTPPGQSFKAMIGALQFPYGTIIIGVVPDTALDATVMAILQSITLEAPADIPAVTPDASISLTTSSFNYLDIKGSVTATIGLPDGWVSQYSDHAALLYIGNSDAALRKASAPDVTFDPGEIAISVALPHAVIGLGIPPDASPVQAIQRFQQQAKAQGLVVEDDSFSVPAAHARLTGGNIPDGGGDVYVLQFEKGLVFIVVQPTERIDGTVMAILQSLQVGALVAPTATSTFPTATPVPAAQTIRQWASSATGTSEYGTDDWSFAQATGRANTPICDDVGTAWASDDSTGRAVLQVSFDQPVIPSQINIYQSFNPGAIVEVDVGSSANPNKVLPLPNSADPVGHTECPGVFSLDVSGVDTPVDFVVIYLDQSLTGNWNEIDAVELVGTPPAS